MHYGRDHDEREQKHGSRIDRELERGSGDLDEVQEMDRRAKPPERPRTKQPS